MDIYSETLIKKKLTSKEKKLVKLLFAVILLSSFVFILAIPFCAWAIHLPIIMYASLAVFGIILFIIWRKLKSMQIEYEYIITNDILDFDMIVCEKKRSRLLSLDIKTVEEIAPFDKNVSEERFDEVFHVEKKEDGYENFYLTVSHPKLKRTLIVFTPDARMLEALKKTLPPRLARTLPNSL